MYLTSFHSVCVSEVVHELRDLRSDDTWHFSLLNLIMPLFNTIIINSRLLIVFLLKYHYFLKGDHIQQLHKMLLFVKKISKHTLVYKKKERHKNQSLQNINKRLSFKIKKDDLPILSSTAHSEHMFEYKYLF